jgi:hypothetical protein
MSPSGDDDAEVWKHPSDGWWCYAQKDHGAWNDRDVWKDRGELL